MIVPKITKHKIMGRTNKRVKNSVPDSVVELLAFSRSISTLACINSSVMLRSSANCQWIVEMGHIIFIDDGPAIMVNMPHCILAVPLTVPVANIG